jgi:hypothetical protein
MNAQRPATRLDNLLQEFKRLARQGLPMPRVTDIARVVGVGYNDIYRLIDLGQERCLWTLERDGARIIAIRSAQGDWKLACSMRRNAVPAHSMRRIRGKLDAPTALSRKCLRCREAFPSAHIGNRLCVPCNAYAVQAAP